MDSHFKRDGTFCSLKVLDRKFIYLKGIKIVLSINHCFRFSHISPSPKRGIEVVTFNLTFVTLSLAFGLGNFENHYYR
jgi:hypothetical protein